jgi:hypothetical protein
MSELDQSKSPVTRKFAQNRDELEETLLIRGFWERGTDCIIARKTHRHRQLSCQVYEPAKHPAS